MNGQQWAMLVIVIGVAVVWYLNSDSFNLKCVVSTKDGKTYCVRDTAKLKQSADLLAEVTMKMKDMVAYMKATYPKDERVVRLVKNFNPKRVVETLPTSEYTAYSENKGQKLAFCLREKKDKMKLIDLNTLTFVALHELTHLMTTSVGHHPDFWDTFKFMLENAVEIGLYEAVDYSKEPQEYCGMRITDNPLMK
jgi:hypothetical protein